MTAPLRSTQFYQGTPPAPGSGNLFTDVYTVPAGHRIILKNIHAQNPGSAAKIAAVNVDPSYRVWTLTMAAGAQSSTDWWMVLNPAETLSVLQQSGGTISYTLSGYLLYI